MILKYELTGSERKKLVQALAEILGADVFYNGAPSYSYTVGIYTVDKTGGIICPEGMVKDTVDLLAERLEEKGFTVKEMVGDNLTITIPRGTLTPDGLERLKQIIDNKATLLKKAFKTEQIALEESDETISFPWFSVYGEAKETKAYSDFVFALCNMAQEKKRVLVKAYEGDNDKFAMRLFLVQLNMKGDEYKESRKILMQNLTGNSAWRYGVKPKEQPTKPNTEESEGATEITDESTEVNNGPKESKGGTDTEEVS